ncbi:hypothetical protein CROQUDRAFT_275501 [Cronartium quercuum f. sp. fusiforme G11]|uniref:Uncharacterized protein n=1 Tax=Cronartium quercuum f. sp. fusiforme G11 TaxID=708437 RepID=A0A9P6NMG4_9BASI|nr:hypothetical protein CROQUDRAFT_275501 [Cronartium quercuum f. sp. fusiforme G11]
MSTYPTFPSNPHLTLFHLSFFKLHTLTKCIPNKSLIHCLFFFYLCVYQFFHPYPDHKHSSSHIYTSFNQLHVQTHRLALTP